MKLQESPILRFFRNFFLQPSHPVNLALFRIVVFYLIFDSIYLPTLLWLGDVPDVLMTPPLGFEWFPYIFRIDRNWIEISYYIFLVSCAFSIVGLFTRYSIFVTVVLAFYLLGVPNFFGKVNHSQHHFVLFATILTVSRCSDVWSADAYINYLRTKKRLIPKPEIVYGLPIRIIWVLIGVLYFFAGFWKLYDGGLDWILSNTLKYYMYQIWYMIDWMPDFRIDNYPNLLIVSAALTILFEIGFIFLIFMGRLRWLAVFGGIAFHNMTGMFMRINFKSLWYCYIIFFDWSFLYNWYTKIFFRNSDGATSINAHTQRYNLRIVSIVGGLLILGNIYAGAGNYIEAWYFTCYPTFQYVKDRPATSDMVIVVSFGNGNYEKIDEKIFHSMSRKFQHARFYNMLRMLANDQDQEKFMAFWNFIVSEYPELKDVRSIKIYDHYVSTLPNLKDAEPINIKLLAQFDNIHNLTAKQP